MNVKGLKAVGLLGIAIFAANSAHASNAYMNAGGIFAVKYPGNTTTCFVCHTGTPGTFIAYGLQFKAAGGTGGGAGTVAQLTAIDGLDADGDGYTNGQEVNGNSDLNLNTSSPFTVAVTNATIADTILTNFVVKGDGAAVAQAFTDPYSLATAGKEILGAQSVTVNSGVTDIYYKAAGVDSTALLYMVDPYGQGTLSPMGPGWTANADGSLHIVTLPAGVTQVTGVLVRTIPVTTPVGGTTIPISGDNDGEGDDDGNNTVGCITSSFSTPLFMTFMLLGLGFFARRKKD